MKMIKKYTQFITENIEADMYAQDTWKDPDSSYEEMMNDRDNIWFVTDNGRPVSGWSYLKDAIVDGILSDNMETGDEWDMEEDVDSYLGQHGYGEDYEEMEEYDQDVIDAFMDDLLQKYAPTCNLRVIKHPQTNN
jgi:hypothetical protein